MWYYSTFLHTTEIVLFDRENFNQMDLSIYTWAFSFVLLIYASVLEAKVYESVKRAPLYGQCRTIKYDYTIRIPGCLPKTIKMRMCGGGCSSRISPHDSFCSRCYPSSMRNATTIVQCPFSGDDGKATKTVTYLRLRKCNCRQVECVKWTPEEQFGFTRIKFSV